MDWNKPEQDLGTLRVGQVTEIIYEYTGPNPELIFQHNIQAGCHCSVPEWNPQTKQLKVTYKPNPVPPQYTIRGIHSYDSTKHVLVNYAGKMDKLIFTAKIKG